MLVRSGPRTFTTHDPHGIIKRLCERGYGLERDPARYRKLIGTLLGDWFRPVGGTVVLLFKPRSAPILVTMGGLVVVVPIGRCERAAARAITLAMLTIADTASAAGGE